MQESPDILDLGLLFGSDTDDSTDDLPEVLSFQHKLIQEMVAAYYIADCVTTDKSILERAFPTYNVIRQHLDVLQFTCGLLAGTETGATPVVDYVSKLLVDLTLSEQNAGKRLSVKYAYYGEPHESEGFSILRSLEHEGSVYESSVNPYIAEYPQGGHRLAKVLANTRLVYISGFNGKDDAPIQTSNANIILDVSCFTIDRKDFHRLWKVLHSTRTKLVTVDLDMSDYSEKDFTDNGDFVDEVTKHIIYHGSDNSLVMCCLQLNTIPNSFLTCLSLCKQLKNIKIEHCCLKGRVNTLLDDPPPALRGLVLEAVNLDTEDVQHIAGAIHQEKLPHLQRLDISRNIVGELALECLLEAFLATRDGREHGRLQLALGASVSLKDDEEVSDSSDSEDEEESNESLSDDSSSNGDTEDHWADIDAASWSNLNDLNKSRDPCDKFIRKWNKKLKDSNIKLIWHVNRFSY